MSQKIRYDKKFKTFCKIFEEINKTPVLSLEALTGVAPFSLFRFTPPLIAN